MKRKYDARSSGTYSQHRPKYFATSDKVECNLSRFWRDCRERDIRKRRYRISNQYRTKDNEFTATINQLKVDAQVLSGKFQRINEKTNKHRNKESRRRSMGPSAYSNTSQISSNTNRRQSNIFIPSSNINKENADNQKTEQTENAKIFFENKKYYSSLHNKYDLNSTKSNIECIYNYFDSSKKYENTLKNKIQQKWQELKNDVNKLNYSHKTKVNEMSNQQTQNKKIKKQSVTNIHIRRHHLTKPKQNRNKGGSHRHIQMMSDKKTKNIIVNEHKDPEQHESIKKIQIPSEITETNKSIIVNKHSSTYRLSNLQKSNEYWDYSVRDLKDKLLSMNVSIDKCVEKRDLIQKIKACNDNVYDIAQTPKAAVFHRTQRKQQKVQNQSVNTTYSKKNKPSILYDTILHDTRESKQQIMNRVDLWIHQWSYRLSFRQLLNSILGYKHTDKRYISRVKEDTHNYEQVMKLYKKAMLQIHPDKHVNSTFEVKYKSVEMFKVITAKCDKYRQRHKC